MADNATSSLTGCLPTIICVTEEGCSIFLTCLLMALKVISTLSDFTPPVVEPEHPHWNTAYMSRIDANTGQSALSAEPNPVVVIWLLTWNTASRKARPHDS